MTIPQCTGCGECCIFLPCFMSVQEQWSTPDTTCLKLVRKDGRFWCSEIMENITFRKRMATGKGCLFKL